MSMLDKYWLYFSLFLSSTMLLSSKVIHPKFYQGHMMHPKFYQGHMIHPRLYEGHHLYVKKHEDYMVLPKNDVMRTCMGDFECPSDSCCIKINTARHHPWNGKGRCKTRSTIEQNCAPFRFLQTRYCGCIMGLVCSQAVEHNSIGSYVCKHQRREAKEFME